VKRFRTALKCFCLILCLVLMVSCSKVETVVFKNVNVISMTSETILENQDVFVKGNQIEAVLASGTRVNGEANFVIDGKGKFLIPGLADMHVHIYQNIEGSDLPLYIANGVTTIRDCNGREFILKFREEVEKEKRVGPRILCTTYTIRGYEKEPWKLVKERYGKGYDAVKFYSNFKTTDDFRQAMNEAKDIHAYTIGHIPYTVGLDGIIQQGMDEIAHVEEIAWEFAEIKKDQNMDANGWLRYIVGRYIQKYSNMPLHKVKAMLQLEAKEIVNKLKGKNIAVNTTCHYTHLIEKKILDAENYINMPHLKYLPPDYFINVGLGQEKHQRQFGEIKHLIPVWATMLETLLIQLHKDGVLVTGGTDALWDMGLVPGFSLHDELAYFVEIGLTPYDAIKMCTANAGEVARRMIGLEETEFGTVETGKRADLVLLDHNPLEDIHHIRTNSGVMANGKWYSKEACSELLAFDDSRHQAYLDVFKACQALRKNDEAPFNTFMQNAEHKDIKKAIYQHRNISEKLLQIMHQKGQSDRVKEYFKGAVQSNWDDFNYLNAISWNAGCEMRIKAIYPEAIRAVKRAIELREHAGIYDTLAWLYALNGEYENALKAIDEARKLDPDNKAWDETREKIIKMQKG